MVKKISKKGALKAFYYLMAIDGDVSKSEVEKFNELGLAFDADGFEEFKNSIISECQGRIDAADLEDEIYDIILEGMDQALSESAGEDEDGVSSRLLMWDLISVAYSDEIFSDAEKRLIMHVSRKLGIEKDVFMEMEHLMKTADAIMKELDELEKSSLPYSEIRPIVDEIEKRKVVITKAAENLIEDEFFLDHDNEEEIEKKTNLFSEAGQMISDKAAPVAQQANEYTQKTKEFLGEKTTDLKKGFMKGTYKIFKGVSDLTSKAVSATGADQGSETVDNTDNKEDD